MENREVNPRYERETRSWRVRSGWLWLILLFGAGAAVWLFLGPRYYSWALGKRKIDILVFCDTADLSASDMKAFVLYDKVALAPPALALGVCQNRAPEDVKVFYVVPAGDVEITPFSARLKAVPRGPIARVMFTADGKKFHVNVRDRRTVNDIIYVRTPR